MLPPKDTDNLYSTCFQQSYHTFIKYPLVDPQVYDKSLFEGLESFLSKVYLEANRSKAFNFTARKYKSLNKLATVTDKES